MIVEIREKGKKTRLIENAIEYLRSSANTMIILISPKKEISLDIKNKLITTYDMDGDRIEISNNMTEKKITGSRFLKNYVYNFDFIDKSNLIIDEDAYYITEIKSNRDFTRSLIDHFKKQFKRTNKIQNIINEKN